MRPDAVRGGFQPANQPMGRGGLSLDEDLFGPAPSKADTEFDLDFAQAGRGETIRPRGDSGIDKAFDLSAINPLVSAAAPLLWLAGRLNESAAPDDIAEFRNRTLDEIKRFE
ncbi:hypothetical protein AB4144_42735, partial [Rhizobiaceae sp. 2RAB30]